MIDSGEGLAHSSPHHIFGVVDVIWLGAAPLRDFIAKRSRTPKAAD